MLYRHLQTLMALPERIWKKFWQFFEGNMRNPNRWRKANHKLVVFFDELQKMAKDAFGTAAHAIIEQFIYAKMQPNLKKSMNQAHLENSTYEQIVTRLEKELQLNGLGAPDELQMNTLSQNTTNANVDRPKPTCHHCRKQGHYRDQCRLLKK